LRSVLRGAVSTNYDCLLVSGATMSRMTATDEEVVRAFREDYQTWLNSLPADERERVIAERQSKIERLKISLPLAVAEAERMRDTLENR